MAYNLQPLITILEQILDPKQTRWIVDDNKAQLQSLLQKSVSLQQIFEKSPLTKIESLESQTRDHNKSLLQKMAYNLQPLITIIEQIFNPYKTQTILDHNKIQSLESEIRDAAHKAEDMIESHMVHQMLSNPNDVSFAFSTPDLQQVIQKLDSVMEQVVKLIEENTTSSDSSSSGVSFSHDLSSKSIVDEEHSVQSKAVVGVDEDMRQLKDRVMGMQSKLEVVPIVGMGGIGKTTLARKLYQDRAVVEHFMHLAWITVSQDYDIKAILLKLLRCLNRKVANKNIGKEGDKHTGKEGEEYTGKEIHELKDILYRSLYGRRYIIVLDDIWSIKFWDEIRIYLPDNNKGSRIVITTRESDVAKHANSHGKQHEMQLLNESESWDLLRQEVFGDEEDCPAALERIGRDIARNCVELPLAISVIGWLLSKANRTQGFWKNVANDVTEAVESDKQFSNILSLSNNHSRTHLRPCFLYMGAFPRGL